MQIDRQPNNLVDAKMTAHGEAKQASLELVLGGAHTHVIGGQRHVKAVLAVEPVGGHDAAALDLTLATHLEVVASKALKNLGSAVAHVDAQGCG